MKSNEKLLLFGGAAFEPTDIDWTFYINANQGDLNQTAGGGGSAADADGDPVGDAPHHEATIEAGGSFQQSTSSAKPTYKTLVSEFGNRRALLFDGGDYMSNAALSGITDTLGTFVFVFKLTAIATTQVFFSLGLATGDLDFFAFSAHTTPDFRVNTRIGGASGTATTFGVPETNNAHILILSSNGTSYSARIDGAAQTITGGDDNGNWLGDVPAADIATIGALERSPVIQFFGGHQAAMYYMGRALTTKEISDMETWAADYYGIAIS